MRNKEEVIHSILDRGDICLVKLMPNALDCIYVFEDGSYNPEYVVKYLIGKVGFVRYGWFGDDYEFVRWTDELRYIETDDMRDIISINSLDCLEIVDISCKFTDKGTKRPPIPYFSMCSSQNPKLN